MKLEVRQEEVIRYELVKAALEGRATNAEVAQALGLSIRQVQRLKPRVKERGLAGVIHARRAAAWVLS